MNTEWNWSGARWWKFDFHTHTPASDDYGKGPDQARINNRTPKEWLLDYMRAGIDCVAITDHNSGAWIDQLKSAYKELSSEKPEGFRPIYLFPGVEISVNGGIHLLAIFDLSKTTSDIDSLLGAVGFNGNKGKSDDVTTDSFTVVVDKIHRAGGIAIPAHVDKEKGLFTSFHGTTLEQALEGHGIVAMEIVDPLFDKPSAYLNKKLQWSEIIGTDAHHPNGSDGQRFPGSHFTWVKMGTPSLEGLWLALLDGPLSIRRSDQETGDPNGHAPLVLESIEITQARYMGRAKPFTLRLNPWLNAIVGGRGTGKSTLIEFLRLALRRTNELPKDLMPEFEKYTRVYTSREDPGLLTSNAELRVVYRKHGSRFRIQWNSSEDIEPIQEEYNGKWKHAEGEIQQRFPIRIYSQKQIFYLAKTPLALLRVVDEAPEVDRQSWSDRWKEKETRFLSLRAKAREIETGLAEEPRLRGELDDVKRRLRIFEKAGHADILQDFQRRTRQHQEVETWENSWADAGERLRQLASKIVPDPLDQRDFDPSAQEDAEIHEYAATARARLKDIADALGELADKADQIVADWHTRRNASSWKRVVDAALKAYQDLRTKLAEEKAGDPAAYGDLVQRQQSIEQRLKDLSERRMEVDKLRQEADACLQRLLEIRRELTESRKNFLNNILKNNPYVRIQVVPYGARETIEGEFRSLLRRESGGFEKDIGSPGGEGLLGELYKNGSQPEDIERALKKIKQRIRDIAEGSHDPTTLSDKRFASHINKLPPEAIDRLDLWFPEDSLEVQYSSTGDGQRFRSIQEGSPGQKTAALLAFLLSYGDEPLVLDQPEDDLDNHLIYNLIVTQLREVKRHRQIIVVTHNANIVVNGDAELVVALAARGGETHMESVGGLQEKTVRDTICDIMEGGRDAFEQRYRRIALDRGYLQ